jgi:staphylococcal nuclease domain-containing protein 1
MLASSGTMEKLRAAEKVAKEKRAGLYANTPAANVSQPNGIANSGQPRAFDGTVVRIWSGDQLSVVEKDTDKEHRLQLSSTRAPKYLVFVKLPIRESYPFTEPPILNKHITFTKQETFYEKS